MSMPMIPMSVSVCFYWNNKKYTQLLNVLIINHLNQQPIEQVPV
ncbi:hypothetical protein MARINOS108_11086 [Marinoscillum sp. 108]|nr:hypothetical protein MARINOS108_11086 [Marinoscillum sp. 108]